MDHTQNVIDTPVLTLSWRWGIICPISACLHVQTRFYPDRTAMTYRLSISTTCLPLPEPARSRIDDDQYEKWHVMIQRKSWTALMNADSPSPMRVLRYRDDAAGCAHDTDTMQFGQPAPQQYGLEMANEDTAAAEQPYTVELDGRTFVHMALPTHTMFPPPLIGLERPSQAAGRKFGRPDTPPLSRLPPLPLPGPLRASVYSPSALQVPFHPLHTPRRLRLAAPTQFLQAG